MLRGGIVVSQLTWDLIRQRHDIQEQHYVLHVQTPLLNDADAPRALNDAYAELNRIGLARGTNVDPVLLDIMRMLSAPTFELHGRVSRPGRVMLDVVAAAGPPGAVLAFKDPKSIHVEPIRPDHLAQSIVRLMPALGPGHGQSITLPTDVVKVIEENRTYREPTEGFLQRNNGRTQLEKDADAMVALLKQPRLGGGRLYAGFRPRLGSKRSSKTPLAYLDTESGRWLIKDKRGSTGDLWKVATPATADLMISELNHLLDDLRN
ncbi:MAG TPA: ESX secretion-associated protein EspG [Pseudonocardiaceae bacterium]